MSQLEGNVQGSGIKMEREGGRRAWTETVKFAVAVWEE